MTQGSKAKYTDKQKRKAEHIEESYEARGLPQAEAEARAWATVNAQDGGGKKSGSGRAKSAAKPVSGDAKRATAAKPAAARKPAAPRAAAPAKRPARRTSGATVH